MVFFENLEESRAGDLFSNPGNFPASFSCYAQALGYGGAVMNPTLDRLAAENFTGHTPGPWRAHLDVPTAVVPGHIIKQDDSTQRPVCLVPQGGGTHGKPAQIANARLIEAAPDLLADRNRLLAENAELEKASKFNISAIHNLRADNAELRAALAKHVPEHG